MINVEVADYQPGTGTRYILLYGEVDVQSPHEDAAKLGCSRGDLFVAWKEHGAYTFTADATPSYVAEKLHIEPYMLDALAIAQFIRAKLGRPLMEDEYAKWSLCEKCGLPQMTPRECICKSRGAKK